MKSYLAKSITATLLSAITTFAYYKYFIKKDETGNIDTSKVIECTPVKPSSDINTVADQNPAPNAEPCCTVLELNQQTDNYATVVNQYSAGLTDITDVGPIEFNEQPPLVHTTSTPLDYTIPNRLLYEPSTTPNRLLYDTFVTPTGLLYDTSPSSRLIDYNTPFFVFRDTITLQAYKPKMYKQIYHTPSTPLNHTPPTTPSTSLEQKNETDFVHPAILIAEYNVTNSHN